MLKVNKTMLYGDADTFCSEIKTFMNGSYAYLYDEGKVKYMEQGGRKIAYIKIGSKLTAEIGEKMKNPAMQFSVIYTPEEKLEGDLQVEFTKNFVRVTKDGISRFISKAMIEFMM